MSLGPLMEYQEKIGEYLIRVQGIRPQQVENILLRQQCGDRRLFGEIAVDLRYIERKALERYLNTAEIPVWEKSRHTALFSQRLEDPVSRDG